MNQPKELPVLYSLRNCPYAMRGRIALFKAKQQIELRDVVLSDKPQAMLVASPKATVPILVLPNGHVIDESVDVMLWALKESDPSNLLLSENTANLTNMLILISEFDTKFKTALEAYKCAKRYRENNVADCRAECEIFIAALERRLMAHCFLMADEESLADIALMPFIRQFAKVERQWYLLSPYPKVRAWLNRYLQSAMFTKVMAKHPLWTTGKSTIVFGGE